MSNNQKEQQHDSDIDSKVIVDDDDDDDSGSQMYEGESIRLLDEENYEGDGAKRYTKLRRVLTDMEMEDAKQVEEAERQMEEEQSREPKLQKIWVAVRPAYLLDHLDYESFKVFFRTWVVACVGIVLMTVNNTRSWLGSAFYMVTIISYIIAPGGMTMPLASLLSILSFVMLLCGWAIAIVAEAIAWRIRGYPTAKSITIELVQQGICQNDASLALCVQSEILHGRFLTTRCSVVFMFSVIIGAVLLGFVRRYNRILTFCYIIGMISLSINASYSALFPFFVPKSIGYTILKPCGVSLALILVSSYVIFPVSSNFSYFKGVSGTLKGIKKTMGLEITLLETIRASTPEDEFQKYKEINTARKTTIRALTMLDLHSALVKLEVSFGRADSGDIGEIRSALLRLAQTSMGYDLFYALVDERRQAIKAFNSGVNTGLERRNSSFVSAHGKSKISMMLHESYKPVGIFEKDEQIKHLKELASNEDFNLSLSSENLDRTLDLLNEYYKPSMIALEHVVDAVINWMDRVNEFRVKSLLNRKKHIEAQKQASAQLQEAHQNLLEAYDKQTANRVEFLSKISEPTTSELGGVALGCLYGFLVSENVTAVKTVAKTLLSIDEFRPTPTIITPFTKSSRDSAKMANNLDKEDDFAFGDGSVTDFRESRNVQPRNPDASPPRTVLHLIGIRVVRLLKLLTNKHFLFDIKIAVAAVATLIPLYCRTTCWWYYSHRLIWITIMVLFTLTEFTGDTVYLFVVKIAYTFIACVMGMVGWYICRGNHIGFGAVFFVLSAFMTLYRHFSTHILPAPGIVFCATMTLVMGSSWQTHVTPAGSATTSALGEGFNVAWVRFVTVIIGVTIGTLISLLPRPYTSKFAIRKILSRSLWEAGNLHCDIGKFAVKRAEDKNVHISGRHDAIENHFRAILAKLASTQSLLASMKFEPPLTGVYPRAKYVRLVEIHLELLTLYYGMYHVFDQLDNPDYWAFRITNRVGWSNPSLTSDLFSVVFMASGSLEAGTPLPRVSPAHTAIRHMDLLRNKWGVTNVNVLKNISEQLTKRANILQEKGNYDEGRDPHSIVSKDGALSIIAIVFAHMIYMRIDEILLIVKALVGEEFDADRMIYLEEAAYELEKLV